MIAIYGISAQNKMAEEASEVVCALCLKQFARYTCPRCNVRYCSVACYKNEKHMQCSEVFYKDCFMEALKNERGSSEDKTKMMEMLKRVQEEGSKEENADSNVLDLDERIADIDLNNDPEAVWEALTSNERKDFESAVQSGKIVHMVDLWIPWWMQQSRCYFLQDKVVWWEVCVCV